MAKTTAQKLREIFFGMPSTAYKSIQNPESQPSNAEIAKAVPFPVVMTGEGTPTATSTNPVKVGDMYINLDDQEIYIAVLDGTSIVWQELQNAS